MWFYVCWRNWNVNLTQICQNRMLDDLISSSNKSLESSLYVLPRSLPISWSSFTGYLGHICFSIWQLTKSTHTCVRECGGVRACVCFREWWSEVYVNVHTNSIPCSQTLMLNKYQTESDTDMANQKCIIVSKANRLKVTKYFGSELYWGRKLD